MDIKKVQLSTVVSLVLFLFSAVFFFQSFQYEYWTAYSPGGGFVPLWVSGISTVLCAFCVYKSLREDGLLFKDVFPRGVARKNLFICWACLLFFIVFISILGFLLTSVVMLSILFSLGTKDRVRPIVYGIITTVASYVVFKVLLQVPLPVGLLGDLLGW